MKYYLIYLIIGFYNLDFFLLFLEINYNILIYILNVNQSIKLVSNRMHDWMISSNLI